MDRYKLNEFSIVYLKKLNKIKTTKEVNRMTGYQKLKKERETLIKGLTNLAEKGKTMDHYELYGRIVHLLLHYKDGEEK